MVSTLTADGRFEIELPPYFEPDRTLQYLGRDAASVSEKVEGRTFTFTTRTRGTPGRVRVELRGDRADCTFAAGTVAAVGRGELDAEVVRTRTTRLLGLVIDPRPFEARATDDPVIARLVQGRSGLTIPQTATVFDALVWVIAGQQVSLPVAFALRRRLARRVGTPVGDGLYAPPEPQAIAELEPADLHAISYSRRKAEYLLDIARAIVDGRFDPEALRTMPAARIEEQLLAIRGLGPWSVNYLMMRALGLPDCVPVGDAALTRNLKRFFALDERPGPDETRRLMAPFAPHRSLATFQFWAWQEEYQ
ncbi:MAG: hypothetical protein AAF657_30130 [Acidobacteriota bacterium]